MPYVNAPVYVISLAIPPALLFVVGITLIAKGKSLAATIVPAADETEPPSTAAEFHTALVSTLGLALAAWGLTSLPLLLHEFSLLYSEAAEGWSVAMERRASTWAWAVEVALQIGIGAVLVIKSSDVVALLRRRAATARVPEGSHSCPHCGYPYSPEDYRVGVEKYLCRNCGEELPSEVFADLD